MRGSLRWVRGPGPQVARLPRAEVLKVEGGAQDRRVVGGDGGALLLEDC